jgi:transposase
MAMLADSIDGVVGVDTHRDTLTAAAVTAIGGLLTHATATTDHVGYQQLLAFASGQVPGRRCWAIQGVGSFGAGMAGFLTGHGEQVVEVPRRRRSARRYAAKSDALDAVHIARDALSRPIRRWCAGVGTARRYGCCSPPAATPSTPASRPSTSARR